MMNMLRVVLLICLPMLLFCGCAANGGSVASETVTPPSIPDFQIRSDEIQKVVITLGDGTLTKETTDIAHIKKLVQYLSHTKPFDKPAVSDLPRKIQIQKRNGSLINLSISGGGSIFMDDATKIAYQINSLDKPFIDWIKDIETE